MAAVRWRKRSAGTFIVRLALLEGRAPVNRFSGDYRSPFSRAVKRVQRSLREIQYPLTAPRPKRTGGRSGRRTMRIVGLETWTVSVPYLHDEISSRVARSGVTDTVVRLTADNGLIGWGECTSGPDAASI